MCEQPLLALDAAAVTGQRSVRSDDAMAGNDHRNRVCAVRRADRANRRGSSDALRELGIGDRVAVGNAQQLVPDRELELGAAQSQRNVESLPFTSEVFA